MIARAGGWSGYAFILNNTYFDAYADTVFALTDHVAHETIVNEGSTFNIHGTTQKVCRGRGAGTIVGEEGSCVLYWTTNDVKTCETVYAGAVSF